MKLALWAAGHAVDLPWLEIMQAAQEWGCPPWEVEEGPAIWMMRRREYIKAQRKAPKKTKGG